MTGNAKKVWLEDPATLLSSLDFFPTPDMSKESRFNALTRLVLLVSLFAYLLSNADTWMVILLAGTVALGLIYLFNLRGRKGYGGIRKRSPTPRYTPIISTPVQIIKSNRRY